MKQINEKVNTCVDTNLFSSLSNLRRVPNFGLKMVRLLIKTCFDNQFFPYLTKSFFIQCATRSKIVTTHIIITSVSGLLFSLIVLLSSGEKKEEKKLQVAFL